MSDFYTYNAKLVRVIDGDTVTAMVDLGFSTWKEVKIRFYGIDAYESRTRDLEEKEKGLQAKALVENILKMSDGRFTLKSKGVDKYGRSLGILLIDQVLESGSVELDLNQYLINEGLAVPYFGGTR